MTEVAVVVVGAGCVSCVANRKKSQVGSRKFESRKAAVRAQFMMVKKTVTDIKRSSIVHKNFGHTLDWKSQRFIYNEESQHLFIKIEEY